MQQVETHHSETHGVADDSGAISPRVVSSAARFDTEPPQADSEGNRIGTIELSGEVIVAHLDVVEALRAKVEKLTEKAAHDRRLLEELKTESEQRISELVTILYVSFYHLL